MAAFGAQAFDPSGPADSRVMQHSSICAACNTHTIRKASLLPSMHAAGKDFSSASSLALDAQRPHLEVPMEDDGVVFVQLKHALQQRSLVVCSASVGSYGGSYRLKVAAADSPAARAQNACAQTACAQC